MGAFADSFVEFAKPLIAKPHSLLRLFAYSLIVPRLSSPARGISLETSNGMRISLTGRSG
jgi:hypothetical protein